jgi:membrane-anchored glycerophosphoryl diester phosphodiesterase (GDPDase)
MDTKELLNILRNIHYKCFLIGVIFFILAAFIYMPCKCYVANLYQSVFGISATAYYNMWAGFLGIIKTILIFLFLIPGLAVHWTEIVYNKNHP